MLATNAINVLIVDDLKENLISLEAILNKDKRFNVIRAQSGNEALSCLLKEEIALVLLDVQMPDMNGFEVAEAINGYERTKDIPIIFITAISRDAGHILKGYGVGANDYMVKPIDPDVLRCKVNIFVELNEKKRALESEIQERKRVEADLRFNQVKYERLVESNLFSVFHCNVLGEIIDGNDLFCSLYGFSREDLRHAKHSALSVFQKNKELSNALVGKDTPQSVTYRVELCLNDDRRMPVMFGAAALDDGGHICTLLDLSKERELEMMLAQSQKMEAIGSLAGGVAHDFNNLLTVILGYTDIVMSKFSDNAVLQEQLTCVCDAAQRAALLTNQLLAFGRKQIFQPKAVCLNDMINRSNYMLKPLVGEGIHISLHLGNDLPEVLFDAGQLEQVLMNLLVNARDAMNGRGNIVIETSYRSMDEGTESGLHGVLLRVKDDGCGMSEEIRSHIFEPFYTTKDVGKGTGLGLSTVYGIVKQGGGTIDVKSALGEGAEFTVVLPIFNGVATANVGTTNGKVINDQNGRQRRSIFVVEDEELLRELIKDALGIYGYEVHAFSTPMAAINFSESHDKDMDILLLDIVMPEMNGIDLSKILKRKYTKAKVICMSGYADDLIDEDFLKEADYAFIAKPFSVATLMSKIEESCARRG